MNAALKFGPDVNGKDCRTSSASVPFEHTGRKRKPVLERGAESLGRMVEDNGLGMGEFQLLEKADLTGLAPVEISGTQSREMVGGQIGHLTVSDRGKYLGMSTPAALRKTSWDCWSKGARAGRLTSSRIW